MSFAQAVAAGGAAQLANEESGCGDANIRHQQSIFKLAEKRLVDRAAGKQFGEVGVEQFARASQACFEPRTPTRARVLV